jgi:pyruvate kinase
MHVARINFSHAGQDYSYPEKLLSLVRAAPGRHQELADGAVHSDNMPANLRAVLVDTKGPEIRTGPLQGNVEVVDIASGAAVEITTDEVYGDSPPSSPDGPHRIQIDYKSIGSSVSIGSQILLDDGLIALKVMEVKDRGHVMTVAMNGGPIKKNKGVNLPNTSIDLPALTDKDKQDLLWACKNGADFVAASFIRTAANVRSVHAYLDRCIADLKAQDPQGTYMRPLIISKIENKEGVDNFHEILTESDGIMVARGDLGVEIPFRKVFAAQKMMVKACNEAGKPVIVATQMLDSMQRNPRPTRAEVTDVGTACLDGADAVMLSGETAAGKYPIESVQAMTSIVGEADDIWNESHSVAQKSEPRKNLTADYLDEELEAIALSAVRSAKDMNAKVIILISMSGRVARAVAKHKPTVPVLAFCTDILVARRLQLHRSILPILLQTKMDPGSNVTRMGFLRAEAVRTAKELGIVKAGDRVVTVDRTAGKSHDHFDFSHNIKVSTIRET